MVKITSIKPHENFTLEVSLDDGRAGTFDVSEYLTKGVFVELQNYEYFKKVRNHGRYIAWPNEQDFCADSIAASLI